MESHQHPQHWHLPQWHPDHGDPSIELGHLRSFALKLLSAIPDATVVLETPEPGLINIRVQSAYGTMVEVYSVPSLDNEGHRRLAMFFCPETANEAEIYTESIEDAVNLFGRVALAAELNLGATGPSSSAD